jgi:hypothetical protein
MTWTALSQEGDNSLLQIAFIYRSTPCLIPKYFYPIWTSDYKEPDHFNPKITDVQHTSKFVLKNHEFPLYSTILRFKSIFKVIVLWGIESLGRQIDEICPEANVQRSSERLAAISKL